jgi:divalent metal cation (Fe/Co/Zn/Cd) transporter
LDIIDIHSEIDEIEQRIEDQLGINIVIHMDPVREKLQKTPGERSGTLEGAGIQPVDSDGAK